ncbi:hypothetical protein E2C01_051275 [Portunus trituberculatus]|uniref:Uncharacterized protein n=1 Tax=Portunus trituberculatus TaxID=210409 RepID=A0A5B7GJ50_PORTR|nr:hypothetical protein [Portunus trituberculatus]
MEARRRTCTLRGWEAAGHVRCLVGGECGQVRAGDTTYRQVPHLAKARSNAVISRDTATPNLREALQHRTARRHPHPAAHSPTHPPRPLLLLFPTGLPSSFRPLPHFLLCSPNLEQGGAVGHIIS